MNDKRKIYLILIIVIYVVDVYGQSEKESLLNRRDKLINEINLTNKLIKNTKTKKGSTVHSIKLLDKRIQNRIKLIKNYEIEIRITEQKIVDRESTINKLQVDLEEQKKLYADIIRYSYKNHNYYTKAVYLLASDSFNQFYLRKKYLEQLNSAREEKVKLIERIQVQINYEIEELEETKIGLADAMLKTKLENEKLANEKRKRQGILKTLSKEEKDLRKELRDKVRIEAEITEKIENIIREETKKSSFATLTPEEKLVGTDFERNRGKLPWPTRQGIITEKFGEHFHPVIKGVKVRNNGIDITTIEGSSVRAIFEGEVSKIFAIKGSNYTVIIRHGKYYTVYHNLENVKVNVGQKIKIKHVIGSVAKDKSNNNSIIHFEIWNGLKKMNPEDWITK